jgi:hypothetical protein
MGLLSFFDTHRGGRTMTTEKGPEMPNENSVHKFGPGPEDDGKIAARELLEVIEVKKSSAKGEVCAEERLQEESGGWKSSCVLTSILYDLLRDHIQPGALQKVISAATSPYAVGEPVRYTNGYLAKYADFLARAVFRAMEASPSSDGEETLQKL